MFKEFIVLSLISIALSASNCPFDKRCLACSETACIDCFKSYVDENGLCVEPDKEIENCYNYKNSLECLSCDDGYQLLNGVCLKIHIDKCLFLHPLDKEKCLICNDGIEVQDGSCEGDIKCPTSNCIRCVLSICNKCEDGYSLDSSFKCKKTSLKGCILLSHDDETCKLCNFGYYHTGTACEKVNEEPESYEDSELYEESESYEDETGVNRVIIGDEAERHIKEDETTGRATINLDTYEGTIVYVAGDLIIKGPISGDLFKG